MSIINRCLKFLVYQIASSISSCLLLRCHFHEKVLLSQGVNYSNIKLKLLSFMAHYIGTHT